MTLSKQGYTLGKVDIAEVDMYGYMLGKKLPRWLFNTFKN
ncbi:hypothetical protein BV455_01590 [Parageobacillus caldoxylosilyticus]|nr:hypothetical protein BV455_01590 [Parageobacillus caldoxylosilyticus]